MIYLKCNIIVPEIRMLFRLIFGTKKTKKRKENAYGKNKIYKKEVVL